MFKNWVLVAGDILVVVLFSIAGMNNHDQNDLVGGLLRNVVPFSLALVLAALALGLYRDSPGTSALGIAPKAVLAGLLAGVLGAALRSLMFDRPYEISFVIVSTLFITAGVTVLHTAFALIARRSVGRAT